MGIINESKSIITYDYYTVKSMMPDVDLSSYHCKATDLHIPSVVKRDNKFYFVRIGAGMFSSS
jgi:hypothetical protein